MSDKMRWRYGDTNPVVAAVDSATVIEIGDLLWQGTDDAKPASMLPEPDVLEIQQLFASNFLGVAMERSRSGDITTMRLATTGVFEFDCPSGTFELGDLVAVCSRSALFGPTPKPQLANQGVIAVRSSNLASARVAKREPTATTSVLIDIRSTVMTGGVEGSSRSGV
ncbi:hypothetical protein LCGC14_2808050 [marine sediment metagenome]|uniref:Uncharacterized protein n=1 Tax=marine sediment metagenome TaxID=412755 RepID=A0A0F8YKQ8_9ZZZZ